MENDLKQSFEIAEKHNIELNEFINFLASNNFKTF